MANAYYTAPTSDEITQRYFSQPAVPPDQTQSKDLNAQAPETPSAPAIVPKQPDTSNPGFFSRLGTNLTEDITQSPSLLSGEAALTKTAAQSLQTAVKPFDYKNIAQDVIAMGAAIPIAIAHPINTISAMFSTKENPIGGATVESIKNVVNPDFYKSHPALALVNDVSLATVVGGFLKSGVLSNVINGAMRDVATQATTEIGISATGAAIETGLTKSLLRTAVDKGLQIGDMSVVTEVAKNALLKSGSFTEEQAIKYASAVTDGITAGLKDNASQFGIYSRLEHPVDTLIEGTQKTFSPAAKMVFGEPDKSAVARLYGNDVVAKDPQGFANIEDWASKQTIERGWKDTVDNRQNIMNEWASTVGEWTNLTPQEKVLYQKNYIEASDVAQKISAMTGDLVVPTKFLPPKDINAIIDTINNAPKTESVSATLDSIGQVWTQFAKGEGDNLGGIWRASAEKALGTNPTKEAFVNFVESMGKRQTLNYNKFPEVNKLVQELEKTTGYKIIEAPKGKPISFATNVDATAVDGLRVGQFTNSLSDATSRLIANKTKLGSLMDRLGLSTQGGVEGTLENLYADQFTQLVTKELGEKYPNGIKLDVIDLHTGEVAGTRTIPLDKLYGFLDRSKNLIEGMKPSLIKTRYTVSDMTASDLVSLGMDKTVAEAIGGGLYMGRGGIARQALSNLSFAQTGLMEGIVNLARDKVPGFNKFVNLKFETHFNLNPFYAMRYWFKTELLKAMNLKEPAVSFGTVLDSRLQPLVKKIPYLKDIVAPKIDLSEIKLMADEVLYDLNKNVVDFASNPELITLEKSAGIGRSIQSRNIFLRAIGYNIPYDATAFAKAISAKYGMTLRDALSFSVNNGMKTYNNPAIFNDIRNSVQTVFHYETGVLTSPLMKSINTIWFPTRFEAKVLTQTARWLGSLSPISRLEVMNNWVHFSNWAQTPEGIDWRKKSQTNWEGKLDYLLPYGSMGETIASVLDGQLFNGKTGMIGGLPFGWIINAMRDLSIIPGQDATNPITGAAINKKRTSKNLVSKASAVIVVEDLITQIMPSLPLYTWFGGTITPFRNTIQNITEGALSSEEAGLMQIVNPTVTPKDIKKKLGREFKTVKQSYVRY